MAQPIGIDLGTTFSAIACVDPSGQPRILRDETGHNVTPSVICFEGGVVLVGDAAKERQAAGASEIASFFKRSMGNPNFLMSFAGRDYTATDLSAIVLAHLKTVAQEQLGEPVDEVVITVPAYFNNMQREATIQAGRQAGLAVLSIVSEPTAAALSYGLRPGTQTQRVLVYDLGGGTFDVSLVSIDASRLQVIGTDGDHNLGGKDWDDRLIAHLSHLFGEEFRTELLGDEFQDVLVQAELLKRSLSVREVGDIRLRAGGQVGRYQVSRAQFELLTRDLLERTQRLTERVLEDADLTWDQLNGVIPVGGSTRMPMVRDLLARMSGKPPIGGVQPDEAVALGAAIQAVFDQVGKNPGQPIYGLPSRRTVVDVMSHSLGMIATSSDNQRYLNSILIRKNQPIPSDQTRPYRFRLSRRQENKLEVFLTQGESETPADCAYLGKYVFTGLPPASDSACVIDVKYAYDQSGVVQISAIERATKTPLRLSIEPVPDDVPSRFSRSPADDLARDHLTIYLAFDLSGSMSGRPLDEAKKAARSFVGQSDLTATSIGIIAFSDRVHVDLPASQNAKDIERAIQHMGIGGTGIGNGGDPFDEIRARMQELPGVRYAIVLADGVWAHQARAVKRAHQCHEAGIEIVSVGFGKADRKFLAQVSSSSEQSFFTDLSRLNETFSSIAQELAESGGRSSLALRRQVG